MLRYILLVGLVFTLSAKGQAQCSNKVEVLKATYKGNLGSIEIRVTTNKSYTSELLIEKGSGSELLSIEKGFGSKTITFKNVKPENIYMVVVNFDNEESRFCKRLVQSPITLTAR